MLDRLVERAIERLDEIDGDPDLEADDHAEEDDWPGGSVDDEGEPCQGHEDRGTFGYLTGEQQRVVRSFGRRARKLRKR